MAHENLKRHRAFIEDSRKAGKKLTEIVEALDARNCATTPGTLSRFLKDIGSPYRPREPSEPERTAVDQTVLLTEIFAEVQGAKEESRQVIEGLAGKVAVLTATVEEMEKALARGPAHTASHPSGLAPQVIRRVWARAFLVSLAVCGAIAGTVIARGL